MSTRNPTEWTLVGDTVRFWQDALSRLSLGQKHQWRLKYAENALKQVSHCHDMAPPQTLGELCLERVSNHLSEGIAILGHNGIQQVGRHIDSPWGRGLYALRRKLYMRPENH
jgi:hypothetical protein